MPLAISALQPPGNPQAAKGHRRQRLPCCRRRYYGNVVPRKYHQSHEEAESCGGVPGARRCRMPSAAAGTSECRNDSKALPVRPSRYEEWR